MSVADVSSAYPFLGAGQFSSHLLPATPVFHQRCLFCIPSGDCVLDMTFFIEVYGILFPLHYLSCGVMDALQPCTGSVCLCEHI